MRNLNEVYKDLYFKVEDEWEGDPKDGRPTGLVNISFGNDYQRSSLRCLPEQINNLSYELEKYMRDRYSGVLYNEK